MTTTQTDNLSTFDTFVASCIDRMPNVSAEKIAGFKALAAEARVWLAEQASYIAPAKVIQTYVASSPEAAAKAQQISPRP